VSYSRDEDLISSLKKAKESYAKAHAALALRWIANMANEVFLVKDYILRNADVNYFVI